VLKSLAQYPTGTQCGTGSVIPFDFGTNNTVSIGTCGLATTIRGTYAVAVNGFFFPNSVEFCGACYRVAGPRGSVIVTVVDYCRDENGTCYGGRPLMLSADAFNSVTQTMSDAVTYEGVSCPITEPIEWIIQRGSSKYWFAIAARNTLLGITKMEVQIENTWYNLDRLVYNFWGCNSSACAPLVTMPLSVRVTATNGQVIVDQIPQTPSWPQAVNTMDDVIITGKVQFNVPLTNQSRYCDGSAVPAQPQVTSHSSEATTMNSVGQNHSQSHSPVTEEMMMETTKLSTPHMLSGDVSLTISISISIVSLSILLLAQ